MQKEEERARRKIEKTKERALTILAIRDENERKIEQFIQAAEEEKEHSEMLLRQHVATEEETRMMKERQLKKLLSRKQEAVRDSRIEKHKMRNDVIKMKEDDIKRKQERHEELKRKELEAKEKKEQKKREHDLKVKQYFENKARMEEAEVRRAEALVRALEQREREWIEKLKETQISQEKTFVELEATLMQGSPSSLKRGSQSVSSDGSDGGRRGSRRPGSTDPASESTGKHRAEAFAVGKRPGEASGAARVARSSSNHAKSKNKH